MILMRAIPRLAMLFLLSVALSACESASDRAMKKSPDYKAGYSDGCASAGSPGANMRADSRVRDEQAYQANAAYRAGWGTGFNACRGYSSPANMPTSPGRGPIPDPTPHPF